MRNYYEHPETDERTNDDSVSNRPVATREQQRHYNRAIMSMLGLATVFLLVGIGGGVLLGRWLDSVAGTQPIFAVVLAIIGNAVAIYAIWRRASNKAL